MRLTDEQVMQDNERFANWNANALAELKYCGWNIPHRKSITNDDIHFYAWLCRSAVTMLKEQETANLYKCPNCGTWVSAENVVRCKDCKWRGNKKKCIVAFVADKQDFPLFFYDNRGNWFCADGREKENAD